MLLNPLIPIFFGLFGLICAFIVYLQVRSANEGTGRVKEIGDEIHLGAMVFMAAEYKILSILYSAAMKTIAPRWISSPISLTLPVPSLALLTCR